MGLMASKSLTSIAIARSFSSFNFESTLVRFICIKVFKTIYIPITQNVSHLWTTTVRNPAKLYFGVPILCGQALNWPYIFTTLALYFDVTWLADWPPLTFSYISITPQPLVFSDEKPNIV